MLTNALSQHILYLCDLYLFTHTCNGDIEHFAVLRHRAAGDAVALLVENIHKVLVGKWVVLILLLDALLKDGLYLVA